MESQPQREGDSARNEITVQGKFLFRGAQKLDLRGVTYGTFAPSADGAGYPAPRVIDRDFAQMRAAGVNAVRVYTVPPRWLLDLAAAHGLAVLVGLPWEQHVAFLAERDRRASIERRVREGVRACAGHPAVLGYAVGNEIPAGIVRWHGRARVERFLRGLVAAVRDEDDALVTYVNFPSTEYLDVPNVDFACFNVYLEQRDRLAAYLARLQNLAGDLPLVMAEIGLDSRRNGARAQADALAWQVTTAFQAGAAGAFVFAWTDEWHRGGHDIDDWDFGLTDRARRPKPALEAVARAFAAAPFDGRPTWPRVSVVVCTYNGARTLDECLAAAKRLDYPDYEVVVVSDGSTDASGDIALRHGVRLIETPNRGLSSARNTGLHAATGEIVAYLDDDAYPDPHWLRHVAAAMHDGDYAAVGGPNIPPAGDGWVADCVARAPGGPAHVLLSDRDAEHLPGCNLAIRKSDLLAIGGFDPQFRAAGDDSGTRRGRVYFGVWGTAYFQALYRPTASILSALPGIPEWYLLVAALAAISALGLVAWPFLLAGPLLALVVGAALGDAALTARAACASLDNRLPRAQRLRIRALTTLLHLLQPASRLAGRLATGLTLWRRRGSTRLRLPRLHSLVTWSEDWAAAETRLAAVEARLGARQAVTRRGGPYDRWDLQIRGGVAADARVRMAVEEHGSGRQLIRWRIWPRWRAAVAALLALLLAPALAALASGALAAAALLGASAALLALMAVQEAGRATGAALDAVRRPHVRLAPLREPALRGAAVPEPERVAGR